MVDVNEVVGEVYGGGTRPETLPPTLDGGEVYHECSGGAPVLSSPIAAESVRSTSIPRFQMMRGLHQQDSFSVRPLIAWVVDPVLGHQHRGREAMKLGHQTSSPLRLTKDHLASAADHRYLRGRRRWMVSRRSASGSGRITGVVSTALKRDASAGIHAGIPTPPIRTARGEKCGLWRIMSAM